MRIVLVNHGTASEWGGGDSVQMQETLKVLRRRGHEVDIQNSDRPNVGNADIVHIFNCRVANSFMQQIETCKKEGIPVVVSPIWISIGRAMWGSRGALGILMKAISQGEESISQDLELLINKRLQVNLDQGTLNADGKGTFNLEWQDKVAELLKGVNGMLPNSWLELKSIQTDLNWTGNEYDIAYYGVDSRKFLNADPEQFRKYTGIEGPFVMQAGRIEPGKNQAMLCWALRKTRIPIVLIGGSKHWPTYSNLCKAIGGDQVKIINHLPQDILASAYSAARVHCLASWMDTCGLVSLEAAMSGTALVGSTFGHELEYLKNDAWLANPGDPESIKKAVIDAWEAGPNSKKPQRLKERILAEYNWEKTTTATEKMYRNIIGNV